jgi:hypothetical protein
MSSRHPEEMAVVRQRNAGMENIPTIIFADGSFLVEPSNEARPAGWGSNERRSG